MYQFRRLEKSDISARGLVLSLLSAVGAGPQNVKALVRAGALFEIEATAMRVAINRLQKEKLLVSVERGVYGPGPAAINLMTRLKSWRDIAARKTAWNGDWFVALTAHLGRRNRKNVRARERALRLNGYAAHPAGFWVRPANLRRPLSDHRDDMITLGADPEIIVTRVSEIASQSPEPWPTLWSASDLNKAYEDGIRAMRESRQNLAGKSRGEAAVETLLVGQSVIQLINFDPLLPAEFCDESLFDTLVAEMKAYNQTGIEAWRAFQSERG